MKTHNSHYFNNYRVLIKLLALVICALLVVACHKNEIKQSLTVESKEIFIENAVNINSASIDELEKLPEIGAVLAKRIVEHREKYGKFRRAEHLILVPGISDKRFRQIRSLVRAE